jgi:hypothetical protein
MLWVAGAPAVPGAGAALPASALGPGPDPDEAAGDCGLVLVFDACAELGANELAARDGTLCGAPLHAANEPKTPNPSKVAENRMPRLFMPRRWHALRISVQVSAKSERQHAAARRNSLSLQ